MVPPSGEDVKMIPPSHPRTAVSQYRIDLERSMAQGAHRPTRPLDFPHHCPLRNACTRDRPSLHRPPGDRSTPFLLHPARHRPRQPLPSFASLESRWLVPTCSTSRLGLDIPGQLLIAMDDRYCRDQTVVIH
jgi:hypothetical protein